MKYKDPYRIRLIHEITLALVLWDFLLMMFWDVEGLQDKYPIKDLVQIVTSFFPLLISSPYTHILQASVIICFSFEIPFKADFTQVNIWDKWEDAAWVTNGDLPQKGWHWVHYIPQ